MHDAPTASAPGKLILCGEHAVVYHRPAIAVPVDDLRAYASVAPAQPGAGLSFAAPDLGRSWRAGDAPDEPLSQVALAALAALGVAQLDATITIRSDIPIASGMGSGAAIATAIVRALAAAARGELADATVSALVYESERRYHGTPSGIDNTVVAYRRPILFTRRGSAEAPEPPLIEPLPIAAPLSLLIGDTGVRSATRLPVGDLRRRWLADPQRYEPLFDAVGAVVAAVRAALAAGAVAEVGPLLSQNHALLQQLGVSSPELDRLVAAALAAGAQGAKLSGAGWGGVMIALVDQTCEAAVRAALLEAGAAQVLATRIAPADRVS